MDECGVNCEETLKEVERFLDGELDPNVIGEISHHLSDCHPCMQRVEFRRSLKLIISTKCGGDAVPVDLDEKIRGLIRELGHSP
jgi:mycothiol system anti-sigma-R factor